VSARTPGPQVAIWGIADRRHLTSGRPWMVRWKVGIKTHGRSFTTRTAADGFRSKLLIAQGEGLRFDVETGEPAQWAVTELTVAAWAGRWFTAESATWAPRSRSNAADVLVKALPLLVPNRAPDAPADIRSSIRDWLAGGDMPAYLSKWSRPLADVTRDECRTAQAALGIKDNGEPAEASSISRHRRVMRKFFGDAVDAGHLADNPWPKAGAARAATRVRKSVDVAALPDPATVRELLDAVVTKQPASVGYRALFACMFYAGLRPGEAIALRVQDLTLPDEGWGAVEVAQASRKSSKRWTGKTEGIGDPKVGSFRRVPIPPVLVGILRDWVGMRTDGWLVSTRNGGPVSLGNLERSWRRVTGGQWTPYDLRHCAATFWLGAGVPIGETARRLGHSPEVLLSTYAGVMTGDESTSNAAIEAALGGWPSR
jgi:integrase